jgi:hypothetical protein
MSMMYSSWQQDHILSPSTDDDDDDDDDDDSRYRYDNHVFGASEGEIVQIAFFSQ